MTQPAPPGRPSQDRAVLAVAAVVLALAAVGALLLLLGDDDEDRAAPAPRPQAGQATPTASATPSAPPPTSAAPVPTTPAPAPSPVPTTPPPAPAWQVEAAYLTPEDAAAVEDPGWAVDPGHAPDPRPVLDPCQEGAAPGAAEAEGERLMRSTREAGGSTLLQEVRRYAGEQEAAAAFDQHVQDVARCPEAPSVEGPAGSTLRYELVDQGDGDGVRTALVRLQPCDASAGCVDSYRSYVLLAQSADGVTAAYYGLGEDGDPAEQARALLGATADRLRSATG